MDGQGNISLPSDIGATAMTEREICELFGDTDAHGRTHEECHP